MIPHIFEPDQHHKLQIRVNLNVRAKNLNVRARNLNYFVKKCTAEEISICRDACPSICLENAGRTVT